MRFSRLLFLAAVVSVFVAGVLWFLSGMYRAVILVPIGRAVLESALVDRGYYVTFWPPHPRRAPARLSFSLDPHNGEDDEFYKDSDYHLAGFAYDTEIAPTIMVPAWFPFAVSLACATWLYRRRRATRATRPAFPMETTPVNVPQEAGDRLS